VRYAEIACRLCLLTVFAVALAGKLSGKDSFGAFARSVRQLGVVPNRTVPVVARSAVAAEGIVVVLLAIPSSYSGAAGCVLAAGVLAVFTAAIGIGLRRGNTAPCRCFGASTTPLGTRHVVRNAVLVAIALSGAAAAAVPGPAGTAGLLVAGVAGVVAGATVTAFDDIVALLRPAR
jgi:hypothetical protein